jgi:hypothetical protein
MIKLLLASAAAAITLSMLGVSHAETAPAPNGPLLVELFTSQGCSSCPPAERQFASLADDADYVTIEWHVDYWDRLMHGGSRWKDPFSSPAFTARQRDYNQALRGTQAVYTPQAVLGGTHEFVGSRPSELALARADVAAPTARLDVNGRTLSVSGKGSAEVWFVRLKPAQKTDVKGGENKGRALSGRNIATGLERLGDWTGKPQSFVIPELKAGETCAVFVQDDNHGRVLGAAYCEAD